MIRIIQTINMMMIEGNEYNDDVDDDFDYKMKIIKLMTTRR